MKWGGEVPVIFDSSFFTLGTDSVHSGKGPERSRLYGEFGGQSESSF
jgi:hypothetical protein